MNASTIKTAAMIGAGVAFVGGGVTLGAVASSETVEKIGTKLPFVGLFGAPIALTAVALLDRRTGAGGAMAAMLLLPVFGAAGFVGGAAAGVALAGTTEVGRWIAHNDR